MREIKTKLNGLTIGDLRKLLKDIPDECEISVWDIGNTGFTDLVELEVVKYDYSGIDININIKAESGFY